MKSPHTSFSPHFISPHRTRTIGALFLVAALPLAAPSLPTPFQSVSLPAASAQTPASQAADLIGEAFVLAERGDSRARLNAVRGAASLLPLLEGDERQNLTTRWQKMTMAAGTPRAIRAQAFANFFDAASRRDVAFTRRIINGLPDASARAGGFLALSQAGGVNDWGTANNYAMMAWQAARAETNAPYRARAMTFVAHRMADLNPATRHSALIEASSHVRLLTGTRERDYLLTEVVGAAAKFDLGLARRIAATVGEEKLRNLAIARVDLAEISQTSLTKGNAERTASLAKAAARYDVRAIPVLIQLSPQPDVFRALSDALPAIYPKAQPAIEINLLERMWDYSIRAEPSVYRDQLQSRLARTMILHDLWRGRSWGKQLGWRGGRVQAGAFLEQVLQARRSRLQAAPLQELASQNLSRAIISARDLSLAPATRVEALLLLAGQILG